MSCRVVLYSDFLSVIRVFISCGAKGSCATLPVLLVVSPSLSYASTLMNISTSLCAMSSFAFVSSDLGTKDNVRTVILLRSVHKVGSMKSMLTNSWEKIEGKVGMRREC